MTHKIILDTDIGTYYDDAFATLLAALSPEIELLGVTTVYGDTDLRSRIARKVLDVAGRADVPVFKGIGKPLRGNALMFGFEGENILDENDRNLQYNDEHAVNFIIRTIMENPGEVTVVTLGAVSNLAMAYIMEPRIAQNMKELIMMAGVVVPIVDEKGVRRSPVEEYNFNNDPIAAQIVVDSDMPKLLVPIDVTLQIPLRPDQVEKLHSSDAPSAKLVSKILDVWPPQERAIYLAVGIPTEHTGLWLHDPLTVALVYDRSFCEIIPIHIDAEFVETTVGRDMLIKKDILRTLPKKLEPNMNVAVTVEAKRFTDHFTARICREE
jgi:inosine-uridine nucleoside N-ribohydrolase